MSTTDLQKQGDGCLLLVDPPDPIPDVLPHLLIGLTESLNWINEPLRDDYRFRVRAAFDAGNIRTGATGFVGHAVVGVARLVNSPELRAVLRDTPDCSLAVAVSNNLYQAAAENDAFRPMTRLFRRTVIEEKEYLGWAYLTAFGPGRAPGLTADG